MMANGNADCNCHGHKYGYHLSNYCNYHLIHNMYVMLRVNYHGPFNDSNLESCIKKGADC